MKYERLAAEVESRKDVTLYIPRYPDEIVIPQVGYLVPVARMSAIVYDIPTEAYEDNFDYQVGRTLKHAVDNKVGHYMRVYYIDGTVNIDLADLFLDLRDAMRYATQSKVNFVIDLSTGKTIIRKDKKDGQRVQSGRQGRLVGSRNRDTRRGRSNPRGSVRSHRN